MAQGLGPLFVLVVVSMGAAGSAVVLRKPSAPAAPVVTADFNHARHIEFGVECAECHVGAEEQARAGVVSITICTECHEEDSIEDLGATPNARLIQEHIETGEQLWWPKLYTLPDHVVFSHRRHVIFGEVECATCHGDIAETTTLPSEPVWRTLTMDGCMECHERAGANLDCLACHR